jgi:hypothetical protein
MQKLFLPDFSFYPSPTTRRLDSFCMKPTHLYTLLKKGVLHPVYCEDFQIAVQIEDEFDIYAVMDGCSAGTDSHFASALLGKSLCKAARLVDHRQIWSQLGLNNLPDPQDAPRMAEFLLRMIFADMRRMRNEMMLEKLEMLSTLVLMVYDQKRDEAFITVKGDGYVAIDGQIHEIDEGGAPMYMGYFLGKPVEEWLAMQDNAFHVSAPRDISIATDGVEAYLRPDLSPDPETDSARILLTATDDLSPEMMENHHLEFLRRGLRPVDDVSVIRLRFDRETAAAG